MKSRWYANWLIVITICLFLSSLTLFVISIKDTIGFTKCAYGDNLEENCICSKDGEKICEDNGGDEQIVQSKEFNSSSLNFSYSFSSFVDSIDGQSTSVNFSDISYIGGGLRVGLELMGYCNEKKDIAPQIGLYKLEKDRLTLTVASNVNTETFTYPCITDSIFVIGNFPLNTKESFKVMYQDEYNVIYPSNNCVYEGYIRNNGDVYNSLDGCKLCHCKMGVNECEEENSCL